MIDQGRHGAEINVEGGEDSFERLPKIVHPIGLSDRQGVADAQKAFSVKAARLDPRLLQSRKHLARPPLPPNVGSGPGTVSTIWASLYQKFSTSRENGAIPGPSKLYSGIAATSRRVMPARWIHHGAMTQTWWGAMPAVSIL